MWEEAQDEARTLASDEVEARVDGLRSPRDRGALRGLAGVGHRLGPRAAEQAEEQQREQEAPRSQPRGAWP